MEVVELGLRREAALPEQIRDFLERSMGGEILDRVESVPGVASVGMTAELPAQGGFGCTVQGFEEQAVYDRLSDLGLSTCAGQEPTTPGYFEAAGIPLLRGRTFTMGDNDDPATGAVVVSQAFADRFWSGEDPIGKGVAPNGRRDDPFYRVVGVVDDVPAGALGAGPAVAIYYPVVAHPETPGTWACRHRWWTCLTTMRRCGRFLSR